MSKSQFLKLVAIFVVATSLLYTTSPIRAQEKESNTQPKVTVQESYMVDGRSGKDYLRRGETDVLITSVTVEGKDSGPTLTIGDSKHTVTAEEIQFTLVRVHGREKFVPNGPYEYVWADVSEENGAAISYGTLVPKKRYVQKELSVGLLNKEEIPLFLLAGTPFTCSSFPPQGSILRPITIRVSDAKGPLLIPAASSLVPVRFQPFGFFSCAVGVTWEFTKKGISFDTDDATFLVEKDGAKVTFTKEGPSFKDIKRVSKKRR
jgi:hypothetical protein